MKWAIFLLSFMLPAGAGTGLPEVSVAPGRVAVSRTALLGAKGISALVVAEDRERDIAILAAETGDAVRLSESELKMGASFRGTNAYTVTLGRAVEVPGLGLLWRADYLPAHGRVGGPLFDESGGFAAWHVVKMVDGQPFSFVLEGAMPACLAERAGEDAAKWTARSNTEVEKKFLTAIGYFWLGDSDGASYHLRKYLALAPKDARAWGALAMSEGKLGRTKERMEAYRRARAADPLSPQAQYDFGLVLLLEGKAEAAYAEIAKLSAMDPIAGERLRTYAELMHVDSPESIKQHERIHPAPEPPPAKKPAKPPGKQIAEHSFPL